MLLVDGLPADLQLRGDLLPGPPETAGVGYLERLELLEKAPERGDPSKSHPWIPAGRLRSELRRFTHARQYRLTLRVCQPTLTRDPSRSAPNLTAVHRLSVSSQRFLSLECSTLVGEQARTRRDVSGWCGTLARG